MFEAGTQSLPMLHLHVILRVTGVNKQVHGSGGDLYDPLRDHQAQ